MKGQKEAPTGGQAGRGGRRKNSAGGACLYCSIKAPQSASHRLPFWYVTHEQEAAMVQLSPGKFQVIDIQALPDDPAIYGPEMQRLIYAALRSGRIPILHDSNPAAFDVLKLGLLMWGQL